MMNGYAMYQKSIKRLLIAFATLLLCMTSASAWAITLSDARTQGFVGERPDGLIGAVSSNASSEVVSLVSTVNAARLDSYRGVAEKDGAPLQAVQAIAGEKLMQTARQRGWYVMDSSGRWSR